MTKSFQFSILEEDNKDRVSDNSLNQTASKQQSANAKHHYPGRSLEKLACGVMEYK